MKTFLLYFLIILPLLSVSQTVEWGGFNTYKGNTIDIIQDKDAFFTLRNKKKFIFNSTHISKFAGFQQQYSEKLKNKIGGKTAAILGFEIINNQPFVFLQDEYQSKNILYIQKLNNQGLAAGPVIEIMQYEMPKSWFNKGRYFIDVSKNKKYIFISYHIELDKYKRKTIGYKIIDNELKSISQGTLNFEQQNDNQYEYDFKISNSSKLFLLKKINTRKQSGLFNSYQQITNIEFHEIKNDSLKSIPINSEKLKLNDLKIDDNDHQISIAGIYTNDETNYKIAGSYFFNYNFINNETINEGKTVFDTDFIIQHWSERAKKRALEREAKGIESSALYDYYIKGIIPMKDSSVIFLLEQYYVNTVNYTDPRTGYISTRYIYHYNDVIIGKILPTNKIAWMKMIPKNQTSENDGGYYSSFSYYNNDNQLKIFFNDIATSYEKSGAFKEKSDFVLFSKLRKLLATVELDLKTGEYKRYNTKYISKRSEFSVPQLFSNNVNTNTFILFLRKGKKENFGIIKY